MFLLFIFFISCLPKTSWTQELPAEVIAYPDTILFNGTVLTVDNSFSVAQALAIRGEEILAVGNTERVLGMAGPNTRKIDLRGKTVLPDLIDTHHPQGGYAITNMLLEEKGIQWEG